jgi:capsular exopolysaccharide synthesis family protein
VAARLERRLVESQSELRSLQHHLGPRHPDVVESTETVERLEQHLAEMNSKLRDELANANDPQFGGMLVELVLEELRKARHHETKLLDEYLLAEDQAVSLHGKMVSVAKLERQLEVLRSLHDGMLNRISNIDMTQHGADVRVAVVGRPTSTGEPVSPSLPSVLLICTLVGFGGAAAIIYVLDVLDDRFRSPDELAAQLDTQLLALIRQHGPYEGVGAEKLQVCAAPNDVESEAFRTLRTALAFSEEELSRLVVSSAEAGDGKTTIAANLAASFAQAGKKTLLIDADMRRPGLTRLFAMQAENGLSDVLRVSDPTTEEYRGRILSSGVDGLDIMPCGPRPPDPPELLGNGHLADLLAWAETVYDQVLIDSPPLLAVSDTAVIGRFVDGLALVVQPHKSRRRAVVRAAESVRQLGVNLIGVVVNGVGDNKDRGYYGRDAGYDYVYRYDDGGADDDQPEEEPQGRDLTLPIEHYRHGDRSNIDERSSPRAA